MLMRTYFESQGRNPYRLRDQNRDSSLMCGLAGFIGRGDCDDLEVMMSAMRHRGPDREFVDGDTGCPLRVGGTAENGGMLLHGCART
jgi:hypothetical protein